MTISDKALLHVLKLLEESDNLAIEVESGGMRLTARKGDAAAIPRTDAAATGPDASGGEASAPSREPAPAAAAEPSADVAEDGMIVLRSPMKGTFYRAPAPGEPPFCDAGDRVGPRRHRVPGRDHEAVQLDPGRGLGDRREVLRRERRTRRLEPAHRLDPCRLRPLHQSLIRQCPGDYRSSTPPCGTGTSACGRRACRRP